MSDDRTNAERQARWRKRRQAEMRKLKARIRELEAEVRRMKAEARRVARSDSDEPPAPRRQALAELPPAGFVTLTTVLEFLGGVSRPTLRRLIRQGFFPPADMLIGGRWPRWRVQTLHRFAEKPPKTTPPLTQAETTRARKSRRRAR